MGADNKLGGNVFFLEKWVCEGIFLDYFQSRGVLVPYDICKYSANGFNCRESVLLLLLFLLLCGGARDRIQSLLHSRQELYDPAPPAESFAQGNTITLVFHHRRLYDHL